ncbi:hypothetical protein [Ramlibacter sp. PS4R-6]|uniref:hypothetical protein n=1 Tax=Ramlibacter sp. PS4R-6 TaxID=3133438 RepID=UPI0030B1826E
MATTLQSLAAGCKRALFEDAGPAGRTRAAGLLSAALRDTGFVKEVFARPVGERQVAYEDPQLGFCILAHESSHAREGKPHDHGPSWAIYGQAEGQSVMNEFEVVSPGRVRKVRSVTLSPGDAHVYNEGAIHAVTHAGPTRLVRIEGVDLAKAKRGVYTPVE